MKYTPIHERDERGNFDREPEDEHPILFRDLGNHRFEQGCKFGFECRTAARTYFPWSSVEQWIDPTETIDMSKYEALVKAAEECVEHSRKIRDGERVEMYEGMLRRGRLEDALAALKGEE